MVKYYYDKYSKSVNTWGAWNGPTENIRQENTNYYPDTKMGPYYDNIVLEQSGIVGSGGSTSGGLTPTNMQGKYIRSSISTTTTASQMTTSVTQYYSYTQSISGGSYSYKLKDISYNKVPSSYKKGAIVQSNIVADIDTYPENGLHTDSYWYIRKNAVNEPPTITGINTTLGEVSQGFSYSYIVDDPNTTDSLTVTEKLDGVVLRTITNAIKGQSYSIDITNAKLNTLKYGEHTLVVQVTDGTLTATRTVTFTRIKAEPVEPQESAIVKILHKRGIEEKLPLLEESELAYTTDTKRLWLGTTSGNKQLLTSNIVGDLTKLTTTNKTNLVAAINELYDATK